MSEGQPEGWPSRLLAAFLAVLQVLQGLGGDFDALFLITGGVGGLGLGDGGVYFATFTAGVGGEQGFAVVDFVQVDLAQVFVTGGESGGGEHRSGHEQASKSGTLHRVSPCAKGLDAAGVQPLPATSLMGLVCRGLCR